MKNYKITGMSCAACSARVERAVTAVDGVRYCSVNLLVGTMSVDGGKEEDIIAAVRAAGYGIVPLDDEGYDPELSSKNATRSLRSRLIWSVSLLIPLMYFSMGYTMWSFPLPEFIKDYPIVIAAIQLALSLAVVIVNRAFFISGIRAAINKSPNMDTLVSLGSGVSLLWSIYKTATMIGMDVHSSHAVLHELYYESAAMILTLITVGKMLESYAKGKTTSAIKELVSLTPKTATVIRDGVEIQIPSHEVMIDDVFVVRSGEGFAVDGVVIDGAASVDESALTGESMPSEKEAGATVYAATVNLSGFLKCRATHVGKDTTMARVIKTVSETAQSKAPIAKLADRVSAVFVPVVLAVALVTGIVWTVVNPTAIGYALERAIAVLVISCPCALGLATPVAIMVGSGVGAKSGVLFKTATSLEIAGEARVVALDKTGTVTEGKMSVVDVVPYGVDREELLRLALSLEEKSEHPISRAIMEYGEKNGITYPEISDFKTHAGGGVEGTLSGEVLFGGSFAFIGERAEISDEMRLEYERLADGGKTPVFFSKNDSVLGIVSIADKIRPDSREAIASLRQMGIKTVMLTGDNRRTARAVAEAAGVDDFVAELLPENKDGAVLALQKEGRVVMVGDGINDAPALTRADVGMAISRGTDIAIESADVVLVHNDISSVVSALKISRQTKRVIKENLVWAFLYNVIGIPLAAGALAPLGIALSPMFAAFAMSISSFTVVVNALRLNLMHRGKKPTALKISTGACEIKCECEEDVPTDIDEFVNEFEGDNAMETVIKVEGMMCPHCEARVKSAVLAVEGVACVEVSHVHGIVDVKTESADVVEKVCLEIEKAGYKVVK